MKRPVINISFLYIAIIMAVTSEATRKGEICNYDVTDEFSSVKCRTAFNSKGVTQLLKILPPGHGKEIPHPIHYVPMNCGIDENCPKHKFQGKTPIVTNIIGSCACDIKNCQPTITSFDNKTNSGAKITIKMIPIFLAFSILNIL